MKALAFRISGLMLVLAGVSFLTFALNYFAPGDKAEIIAHARYPDTIGVPPEILRDIRAEFNLDSSFFVQYFYWITGILQGDFGVSYASRVPGWVIFVANLGETVARMLSSLSLGLLGAFTLATLAVRNRGTWIDKLAVIMSSVGAAMPNYWLALLLILGVAVHLGWLPSYGEGTLSHLVLPATTLALWIMASQTRLLRSFMLDAYSQPFIETLRLRGISEREIFFAHVIPHARIPALTMIGLEMGYLLEGAVIVEIIFSRSGLGSLLAGAVLARDLPMMMFLVMFFGTTYVVINTAIDALQALSAPRTLTGAGK